MRNPFRSLSRKFFEALFHSGGVVAPAAVASPVQLTPPPIKVMKPIERTIPRVICGMGSGGPEDVNTYAMIDAMSREQRDAIRARSKPRPAGINSVDVGEQTEGPTREISAGSIADVMDRAYERDPQTMKLQPKAGLRTEAEVDAELKSKGTTAK